MRSSKVNQCEPTRLTASVSAHLGVYDINAQLWIYFVVVTDFSIDSADVEQQAVYWFEFEKRQ